MSRHRFSAVRLPIPGSNFTMRLKGDFIARIGHETDERRYVFDVRLFEEPDAAGDLVRDAPARKLQL